MAGYKTHITCSTIAGVALGFFAHVQGFSLPLSVFGGTICSLGGVVPDIDSKTSTSFRLCLAMVSGFSALLLVSRLGDFEFDSETIVIIGSLAFLFTWGVFGTLVKKFTRHRGMFHSLPMALIASEIIFLLTSGTTEERLFKAFSMFLGFMVHLVLDEFYSVNTTGGAIKGTPHLKKSFGTALKMIDFQNMTSTVAVYIVLAVLTNAAINEPVWSKELGDKNDQSQTPQQERVLQTLNHLKAVYPVQYEISVIEWIAENQLVLEPASPDNPKWKELESLFDTNSKDKVASQENELQQNSKMMTVNHPLKKPAPSFLDQLNWSTRQRSNNAESNQQTNQPN